MVQQAAIGGLRNFEYSPPEADIVILGESIPTGHENIKAFWVGVDDPIEGTPEYNVKDADTVSEIILSIDNDLNSSDPVARKEALKRGKRLLEQSKVTIPHWLGTMKTAMALYPLQEPFAKTMLDGTPVDDEARQLFMYGQDAVEIRIRGELFKYLLREQSNLQRHISLACGAAVPEIKALASMSVQPHQQYVDVDPEALSYIPTIAKKFGVFLDKASFHKIDLIKEFALVKIPPSELALESADVVDAFGITEYFHNRLLGRFLQQAYSLVKPGGTLLFANMLDDRPALQFHKQVVEWPGVIPRSVQELVHITANLLESTTGQARILKPKSGGYAVVEVKKPVAERQHQNSIGAWTTKSLALAG